MLFSEIVPLLQTLIWILFVSVLLFLARYQVGAILRALTKNIEKGSTVETPWFKLGQISPKQEDTLVSNPAPIDYLRSIYLRHVVREWQEHQDAVSRRRIIIWLDFFGEEIWSNVIKVIYYFPMSFPQRIITRTNKEEWFSIETAAIGEFSVGAEVFLEGKEDPIRISRYIDFSDFRQLPSGMPLKTAVDGPMIPSSRLFGVLSIQSARPVYMPSDDIDQLTVISKDVDKNIGVVNSKDAKPKLITKQQFQNMHNRKPKTTIAPKNPSGKMKRKSKKK